MKILRILPFLLVLSALILTACGGSAPKGPREAFRPDWYGTITENENFVFTYGVSEKVSQNASEAGAHSNALAEAAQYVEAFVKTKTDNYLSESGYENPEVLSLTEQVTRVVASQRFQGSQITQRKTYILDNGRYQTFMQVAIPKAAIERDLVNRIKKEEALYNRFKASQSFQELERLTAD